jgi:hypothetical protein
MSGERNTDQSKRCAILDRAYSLLLLACRCGLMTAHVLQRDLLWFYRFGWSGNSN